MSTKPYLSDPPKLLDGDLKRTERPDQALDKFHWDKDDLIYIGHERKKMTKALSNLPPSLRESFKQHVIYFSKQGNYSPHTHNSFFAVLKVALEASASCTFDTNWVAQVLENPSVHRQKSMLTQFFLHWRDHESAIMSIDALRFLSETAACPEGPRNVLSDDPEKSWLSEKEYERLLSAVWDNYDNGLSSTQVTLIRLLSMQYARRPVQISLLKIGDIRENDSSIRQNLTGHTIHFPGAKDKTAEANFRDSKFESHPVADHLWDLCQIQIQEVRALYENTLGVALQDDQLKKLPLFCSKERIREAQRLLEDHYQLRFIDSLNSELFHLPRLDITEIINWVSNTPTCNYGDEPHRRSFLPKLPISHRTGRTMVVTATRMRHTRARQLARKGVPKHMLSHWLGHTSTKSLDAYYNDPAEQARHLNAVMAPLLAPLAMAFTGTLLDSEDQATRFSDPTSKLEFACTSELMNVGRCGKHSFCATTSVPIPCYRCRYFEPLVDAPHQEVLAALVQRQAAEKQVLKVAGLRDLLLPIDLSDDILAVENCIEHCNARKAEREKNS